jgi:hypothetical protein
MTLSCRGQQNSVKFWLSFHEEPRVRSEIVAFQKPGALQLSQQSARRNPPVALIADRAKPSESND